MAQALHDNPDLLRSGRPIGPHGVELLIRALQAVGAREVVLPACGHCGKQKCLVALDGDRRICGDCRTRAHRSGRTCAGCGQIRTVKAFAWNGSGLCVPCLAARGRADHTGRLIGHLLAVTSEDEARLRQVVDDTLPAWKRRWRVADELDAHPSRLTDDIDRGSRDLLRLVLCLVEHDIDGFTSPTCSLCGRVAPLRGMIGQQWCCRRCTDAHAAQPCRSCGEVRPAVGRSAQGEPLCQTCYYQQPHNQQSCSSCGRTTRVISRPGQAPTCRRCSRAPSAVCSICRRQRACYLADSDAPRCEPCSNKLLRTEPCSTCGRVRIVHRRTADGAALCQRCSPVRRAHCTDCRRLLPVQGVLSDGPRCKACYRRHPESFRPCTGCGSTERLHHHGLCPRCACFRELHDLLGDPGSSPHLAPVFTALARSAPDSTLNYLRRGGSGLLRRLAHRNTAVTHDVLDTFADRHTVEPLRDALVNAGGLDPRDERLHRFEQEIAAWLAAITDDEHRRLLRGYTAWQVLRRLRRSASRQPTTRGQTAAARRTLKTILDLLEFLRRRHLSLHQATQHDLDRWQSVHTAPDLAGSFLNWSVHNRHCAADLRLTRRQHTGRMSYIDGDHRWTLVRRLLHDKTIARHERFAGLLLLLFGQPAGTIVQLTTDKITQRTRDRRTQLHLGRQPILLPDPLGQLAVELVTDRYHGRAALGRATDHGWIFPGIRAGTHMSAGHLNQRLTALGVPARAGRNATMIDLAGHMPIAILNALLGLSIEAARSWTTEAGQRHGYAVEIARRPTDPNSRQHAAGPAFTANPMP